MPTFASQKSITPSGVLDGGTSVFDRVASAFGDLPPPTDGDGYLNSLGIGCEAWNRFATTAARTLHVRSSARLKLRLGITGAMSMEQAEAIRAAIDARCAASATVPSPGVTSYAPPVFYSEAARAAWIAANARAPLPPPVVPCPAPPAFVSQDDRDRWIIAHVGCSAPSVVRARPNRTLLYVAGGIGVAGLAWWIWRNMASKKKRK